MEGTTSLWWDMESCPLPFYFDPYKAVSMAPALLLNFNISNSMVTAGGGCSPLHHRHFSAYEFCKDNQTLINSGIELQQLPPAGKNNETEKMMMADVLLWAMDTPPPANIVFIVGDVDFSYVFQKLLQRSYNVYLVCRSMSEMPQGMLGVVNGCLGCLSFLRSLQNEHQESHNPGGISVYDHTISNTAIRASSTSIHSKEMEESSNASGFNYSQENLPSQKPSTIVDGWSSTCTLPPTPSDEWDSTCNFPPTVSDGTERTCNFPLDERARSPVQPEPRFHGHSIRTKKPRSPVSSATFTEMKKRASLKEFKEWLTLVLNGKKHAEDAFLGLNGPHFVLIISSIPFVSHCLEELIRNMVQNSVENFSSESISSQINFSKKLPYFWIGFLSHRCLEELILNMVQSSVGNFSSESTILSNQVLTSIKRSFHVFHNVPFAKQGITWSGRLFVTFPLLDCM